jgi:hypothetical protein
MLIEMFYKIYYFLFFDIPWFLKNIWFFRRVLWCHRDWDYTYSIQALRTSLQIIEYNIKNGTEIRETRDKKIQKISRAIQILKNVEEDNYIDQAEAALGKKLITDTLVFEKIKEEGIGNKTEEESINLYQMVNKNTIEEEEHNKQIFELSYKLAEDEWEELWEIFKGGNTKEFDGSDMRGWWN